MGNRKSDPNEFVEVNKILDSRPEIFSLPASIIVPVMFLAAGVGMICYLLQLSKFMGLFTICIAIALYFFLFGREWWRLVVRFQSPPNWVRRDIEAVTFSLEYEGKTKNGKDKSARSKQGT